MPMAEADEYGSLGSVHDSAYSHGGLGSVNSITPLSLPPRLAYYSPMQSSLRTGPGRGPGARRREESAGRVVYPVISRRSGGLSLGIDLFPDAKSCNFDCPYCEVFPLSAFGSPPAPSFSPAELRDELYDFLDSRYGREWAPEPIRDLCFSGSGEPTASPFLEEALGVCAAARRDRPKLLGSSSIVVITNSTGFLEMRTSAVLEAYARGGGLVVWAKLDGGNEDMFGLMSGSEAGLERVAEGILGFSRRTGIVIQTMLCEVDGRSPSDSDVGDYRDLLRRLVDRGAKIREVHLYTFARPTPVHSCAPLGDRRLLDCARAIRAGTGLKVRVFGPAAELPFPEPPAPELP